MYNKSIYRALLYGLILFVTFSSGAQDKVIIDSLTVLLENETDQRKKIDILNTLASKYSNSDSSQTVFYANQAIDLSAKDNYPAGSIDALYQIGWVNLRKRHYDKAIELFQLVVDRSNEIKYNEGLINGLNGLSISNSDLGNYQEALTHGRQALKLSEEINYGMGLAYSYQNVGTLEVQIGNTDKGMKLLQKGSNLDFPLDDYVDLMLTNRKGVVYANLGDLNRALDAFFHALRIEQKKQNLKGISGSYNNIGVIFYQLKDYDKALKYYKEAYKVFENVNDQFGVATYYNNVAIIYLETNSLDSALVNFERSIKLGEEVDFKRLLGWSYDGMSKVYQAQGDLNEGLSWAQKALGVREAMGRNRSLAQTYNTLGKNLLLLGRYDEALKTYNQAVTISKEIENPLNLRDAMLGISQCYEKKGLFQSAYQAHKEYHALNDSLVNDENLKNITFLEAEYIFQQEKDSLQFAQNLETLSYELELNQKSRAQRVTFIGLSIIFLLLLVSLYLFYKSVQSNKMILSQRDDLDKLNKAKTRFFSIISHDLRNPVGQLIGYSDIIYRRISPHASADETQEIEEMYQNQQKAAQRILELLDGLINWALKEEGMVPYEPQLLKIKTYIDQSVALHSIHADNKQIKIDADIEDTLEAWVDKNSLLAIIRNLIGNALKFTDEGGEIQIMANQSNGATDILIRDNGVGISKDDMKKLFKFSDNNHVTRGTSGERGSGLGLNLVHDLVQLNHGKINVDSEIGKGTKIILSFPSSK